MSGKLWAVKMIIKSGFTPQSKVQITYHENDSFVIAADSLKYTSSPIAVAALSGNKKIFEYLLSKGFNNLSELGFVKMSSDMCSITEMNTLGFAILSGNTALVKRILELIPKIDVNINAKKKQLKACIHPICI